MFMKYNVTYYDEVHEGEAHCSGLVFGEDYSDCVRRLSQYYGEDYISSIAISTFEDNEGYVLEQSTDVVDD